MSVALVKLQDALTNPVSHFDALVTNLLHTPFVNVTLLVVSQ